MVKENTPVPVKSPSPIMKALTRTTVPPEPLWRGPVADGITFSLLSRYLVCKERFRVETIDGWRKADSFNHRLEYGSMWHCCEELLAAGQSPSNRVDQWTLLDNYGQKLLQRFPLQQQQVNHWYNVCKIQFPAYVDHWRKHPDVQDRKPLLQEVSFKVPYQLPSGRSVVLRGKWDSVDLIDGGIYLQENKTKADIDEQVLKLQLASGFDLQTMTYLTALELAGPKAGPIHGIRFNVIRRPLSGGKNSIVQKKTESVDEFYERLSSVIWENQDFFFMRWKIGVAPEDIKRFRRECLDPVLENLLDDYQWWVECFKKKVSPFDYQERSVGYPHHQNRHHIFPYGIYNPMTEGKASDVDAYITGGSTVGLERPKTLFPELE
jgi:hypothetical protein